MFKGASSLSISKRNLGPITAAMEKRVALVAPERVHVFERGNMRQTSFYLIMPLCIYFQMGYDLDRFGVSFVTGVNKVHFFISMASDRNSSDHCDGLPSCNASILLPLFVSMNSRCMLFLFSAQHLFEARIKQTFEFSASRTSQTDIRKIRKIRIFRLQPSPPVSKHYR